MQYFCSYYLVTTLKHKDRVQTLPVAYCRGHHALSRISDFWPGEEILDAHRPLSIVEVLPDPRAARSLLF